MIELMDEAGTRLALRSRTKPVAESTVTTQYCLVVLFT